MGKKLMPKRYCGFKMISEDGTPAPSPWKRFTGFKVKEVENEIDEPMEEEAESSTIPNKKLKILLAEKLTAKLPN